MHGQTDPFQRMALDKILGSSIHHLPQQPVSLKSTYLLVSQFVDIHETYPSKFNFNIVPLPKIICPIQHTPEFTTVTVLGNLHISQNSL